jgi:FkbM family methyltransferase
VAGKTARLTKKVLYYPLRLIPQGSVVRIIRGPLRGKKWIVGSSIHRCWLGHYEIDFQRALSRELRPESVFYDIGANVGFYSLLAAKLIFPGRVYAFEPLPQNVHYLRSHIQLNQLRNVEVFEVAISDECGSASFATEESRAMGHLERAGNVCVQSCTVDGLIHENKAAPPQYIKMDVEGAEFRALVGGQACFARFKPTLFLATHGKDVHEACCRLLESWQYDLEVCSRGPDRAEVVARPKRSLQA